MARVVLLVTPRIVAGWQVVVEDTHEEHTVCGLAVIHLHGQGDELLFVEFVGRRHLRLFGVAGEFGGLLVVDVVVPVVTGVHALFAGEELHDVARFDAPDARADLPDVHGLELQETLPAGRQVAPVVGEVHVGVAVLAREGIDVVLTESAFRMRVQSLSVRRQSLLHAQLHVRAVGEFALDDHNRLPTLLASVVFGVIFERQATLLQRRHADVVADHVHVRTLRQMKTQRRLAVVVRPRHAQFHGHAVRGGGSC